MHPLTIPVERWARGEKPRGKGRAYLGNPDGDCCVGHLERSLRNESSGDRFAVHAGQYLAVRGGAR